MHRGHSWFRVAAAVIVVCAFLLADSGVEALNVTQFGGRKRAAALNVTQFNEATSGGREKRTGGESMWVVGLSCPLTWPAVEWLAGELSAHVDGCAIVLAGQGSVTSVLRVACATLAGSPRADRRIALRSAVAALLYDAPPSLLADEPDACMRAPFFAVTDDAPMSIRSAATGVDALAPLWHLDRIDERALPLDGAPFAPVFTGAGIVIYSIDTGVYAEHSMFGGRATQILDLVYPPFPGDCNGHGSHTAALAIGTTVGVARGATLRAIRALSCGGDGKLSDVLLGIVEVADRQVAAPHAAVLTMSLSGDADALLDSYIDALVNVHGVTVVAAAGNQDDDACRYSPGRATGAITVGASTIADVRASFSNYGPCVVLGAPGKDVLSAWYTCPTCTKTLSGTSMATPLVAGALALLAEEAGGGDYFVPAPAALRGTLLTRASRPDAFLPLSLLYTGSIQPVVVPVAPASDQASPPSSSPDPDQLPPPVPDQPPQNPDPVTRSEPPLQTPDPVTRSEPPPPPPPPLPRSPPPPPPRRTAATAANSAGRPGPAATGVVIVGQVAMLLFFCWRAPMGGS